MKKYLEGIIPVPYHCIMFNTKTKNKMKKNTFDIHFNDSENSNNKGFKESFDYCLNYIDRNLGTYFQDYPEGFVSIVCNETGKTVFGKSFTTESYK